MDDYDVYMKYVDLSKRCKNLGLYEDTSSFNNACISAICEYKSADSVISILGRAWFKTLDEMAKIFGEQEVKANALYYCLADMLCMPMNYNQRQEFREQLLIRLNTMSVCNELDIDNVMDNLNIYLYRPNYNFKFAPILDKVEAYVKSQSEYPDKLRADMDKYSNVLLDRTHQFYHGDWYDENEKWADNANFFFDIVKKLCAIGFIDHVDNNMRYIASLRTTDDKYSYCTQLIEDCIQGADHDKLLKIREIFDQNMSW